MTARILLIADRRAADELTMLLCSRGSVVEIVEDGYAAMQRLAVDHFEPDLVVLDVVLPQSEWLQLIERLRRYLAPTPILLVSDRDLVSDRVCGLNAGANDFILRPFATAELLARIDVQLRRQLIRDQKKHYLAKRDP